MLIVLHALVATALFVAAGYPIARNVPLLTVSQRLIMAFAAGSSIWPLTMLWMSAMGLSLRPPIPAVSGWAIIILSTGLCVRDLRKWREEGARGDGLLPRAERPLIMAAAGAFAMVVWTRWKHVEELALPAWVDPIHHTMITRLLLERGIVPETYDPYISLGAAYYHWGFHACLSWLAAVSGRTGPYEIAESMMLLGQLAQVLVFVAVLATAQALFRNRNVAILAATFATLVSWFPAYLTAWGRYTHLFGLIPLMGLMILLSRQRQSPGRAWVAALALCSCSVVLIHARLAILGACFALAIMIVGAFRKRTALLKAMTVAGILAVLLTTPWLSELATADRLREVAATQASSTSDRQVVQEARRDLLWAPGNLALIITATGGVGAFLILHRLEAPMIVVAVAWWIAVMLALRRARDGDGANTGWAGLVPVALASALAIVLANLNRLHLPSIVGLSMDSLLITMFLPLSLAAAVVLHEVVRALFRRASLVIAVVVLTVALGGGVTMHRIAGAQTVIATASDLEAIRWIDRNIEAASRFAIPVDVWLPGAYAGTDGGYWIGVLTPHSTIVPPAIYAWTMPAVAVTELNRTLSAWHLMVNGGTVDVAWLITRGVTHIFVGERSRNLGETLQDDPRLRVIYEDPAAGVLILELQTHAGSSEETAETGGNLP